jgi:hypothetical protein
MRIVERGTLLEKEFSTVGTKLIHVPGTGTHVPGTWNVAPYQVPVTMVVGQRVRSGLRSGRGATHLPTTYASVRLGGLFCSLSLA